MRLSPRTLVRNARNRRWYRKAREQAGESGMVCGYVDTDGRPHYFTMPADASDAQVQSRAFELRHGRPMSQTEHFLLDMAARRHRAREVSA